MFQEMEAGTEWYVPPWSAVVLGEAGGDGF